MLPPIGRHPCCRYAAIVDGSATFRPLARAFCPTCASPPRRRYGLRVALRDIRRVSSYGMWIAYELHIVCCLTGRTLFYVMRVILYGTHIVYGMYAARCFRGCALPYGMHVISNISSLVMAACNP